MTTKKPDVTVQRLSTEKAKVGQRVLSPNEEEIVREQGIAEGLRLGLEALAEKGRGK